MRPTLRLSVAGTLLACLPLTSVPAQASVPAACVIPGNASGTTVDLPPAGCGYVSPSDLHMMINGLPPGTTIRINAAHRAFFNVSVTPGGPLGGHVETFQSQLVLDLKGTGVLASYGKVKTITTNCTAYTGPRVGTSVQGFDTEMAQINGQITGDPDFDLLRVTAGTSFGMPSPGHTTLTRLPGGHWNVDSFFDITYRIDFVGRPGGPLGGMSGSTTGTLRMESGRPAPDPCDVADDGTGTVSLPPDNCGYVTPAELHMMINGLPPGTTIAIDARHAGFFNKTEMPGGSLGGSVESFGSGLQLKLHGTGDLTGWNRALTVQAQCQTHTGPRIAGAPVQSFDTEMFMLQGQLPPGDPDFDLLRITAGTGFGMPSPGHTTLRQSLPGSPWSVDSFFDITYRIDFVGTPTGRLAGMSGSTVGTARVATGLQQTTSDAPPSVGATVLHQNVPNPFNPSTHISFDLGRDGPVTLTIVDASGRVVRKLVDALMQPGRYTFLWDGRDGTGRPVASGAYFYTLTAPDFSDSKSLVLLK